MCKLLADDTGLTIRNYLRTYRLPWTDVERLSTGPCSRRRVVLTVHTKATKVIACSATLTQWNKVGIDHLNEELEPLRDLASRHHVPTMWLVTRGLEPHDGDAHAKH